MGIALSKLWERLFSGKNYKIIIIGAVCRRAAPSRLPLSAATSRQRHCLPEEHCWAA